MPRLRRADPAKPGWARKRRGRGFSYVDEQGRPLPRDGVERCKALVIPPAWQEVWICPWPNGHIQAVGTDDAGRKQYIYHSRWRERRDREKFDRVLEFGSSLPTARRRAARHLALAGMPRERTLAVAFRILDLGGLRIGSEDYAQANGSYGLATLRCDHVTTTGGVVRLDFVGKSGKDHMVELDDQQLLTAVRALRRGRCEDDELLAWREGTMWHDVTSTDINSYLSEIGVQGTAKDFRTWQAGLRALATLSTTEISDPKRAVAQAIRDASDHLGNTPAIARTSYVDPRLVQAYLNGERLPEANGESLQNWEPALLELLEQR